MTPRISIITPSFNHAAFIERTIDSVLAQEIAGVEYVVVDGGSQDSTVEILRRYGDSISWISERDHGQADAVNKGIRRTHAPVVGWLNSDDVYYPGALAAVLEYFDTHPETGVVYGEANHIDANDAFIEKYPTEPWNWERLKDNCFISQPAAFVRRSVMDHYGLLDISVRRSTDYEYWIRLGKNGVRFDHLKGILAATRLHEKAATVAARVECHRENNDILRRHLGSTPDQWLFNYAHVVADQLGMQRTGGLPFALTVAALSWYASLRWNHRVSRRIFVETSGWVAGAARKRLRRKLKRP